MTYLDLWGSNNYYSAVRSSAGEQNLSPQFATNCDDWYCTPNNFANVLLQKNGNDIRTNHEAKVGWWDSLGDPGNYLDYELPSQTLGYYEPMAYRTPGGSYTVSGAYLEKLQGTYTKLAAIEASQVVQLKNWFAATLEVCDQRLDEIVCAFDPSSFNLEKAIKLVNEIGLVDEFESENESFQVFYAIQRLVKTHRIKSRVSQRIRIVRKAQQQSPARFCGLSWARRFWFLLHGSHPPKPETWLFDCQEFGCA